MKKLSFTFALSILIACGFSQVTQSLNYQAVARNNQGDPIASQNISVRASILTDSATGAVQYSELHLVSTNQFGLFNLKIGQPTSVVSGTFGAITWATGAKYLKIEMDPAAGSSFVHMGTSQLLSVPYAMYAGRANVRVTSFEPPGCEKLSSVTTNHAKVADLGTFTKSEAATMVELNFQTFLKVITFTTASGVVYEVRIDDQPADVGNAAALVRSANVDVMVSMTGIFTGLAAGNHTVSLWARGNGTAVDAYYDPGCWNSANVNNVLVKEY